MCLKTQLVVDYINIACLPKCLKAIEYQQWVAGVSHKGGEGHFLNTSHFNNKWSMTGGFHSIPDSMSLSVSVKDRILGK